MSQESGEGAKSKQTGNNSSGRAAEQHPLAKWLVPPVFSAALGAAPACVHPADSMGAFVPADRPGRNGFPLSHREMLSLPCSLPGALLLVLSEGSEMPLISSHSVIPMTLRSSLYEFLFVD